MTSGEIQQEGLQTMLDLIRQDWNIVEALTNLPLAELLENQWLQTMIIKRCVSVLEPSVTKLGHDLMTAIATQIKSGQQAELSKFGNQQLVSRSRHEIELFAIPAVGDQRAAQSSSAIGIIFCFVALAILLVSIGCSCISRTSQVFSPSVFVNQYNDRGSSYSETNDSSIDDARSDDVQNGFVRVRSYIRRRPGQ